MLSSSRMVNGTYRCAIPSATSFNRYAPGGQLASTSTSTVFDHGASTMFVAGLATGPVLLGPGDRLRCPDRASPPGPGSSPCGRPPPGRWARWSTRRARRSPPPPRSTRSAKPSIVPAAGRRAPGATPTFPARRSPRSPTGPGPARAGTVVDVERVDVELAGPAVVDGGAVDVVARDAAASAGTGPSTRGRRSWSGTATRSRPRRTAPEGYDELSCPLYRRFRAGLRGRRSPGRAGGRTSRWPPRAGWGCARWAPRRAGSP